MFRPGDKAIFKNGYTDADDLNGEVEIISEAATCDYLIKNGKTTGLAYKEELTPLDPS